MMMMMVMMIMMIMIYNIQERGVSTANRSLRGRFTVKLRRLMHRTYLQADRIILYYFRSLSPYGLKYTHVV